MAEEELLQLFALSHDETAAAFAKLQGDLTAWLTRVVPAFVRGGRLISFGAGTSGRLAVLDASEIPPTFCCEPTRIQALIAGGDGALRRSSEGAEDDPSGFIAELEELAAKPRRHPLGIAAGGTTPAVRGALSWAADLPQAPHCALLSCAPPRRRMTL